MSKDPQWLVLGSDVIPKVIDRMMISSRKLELGDLNVNSVPFLALCHFSSCLNLSIEGNSRGYHSAAMALLRQCLEALSLIGISFLDSSGAKDLLRDWSEGRKSNGDLRKFLENNVWHTLGEGLWDESWSDFYANLSKAIQPYAHYSPQLQGWQWTLIKQESDNRFIMGIGPASYDPMKASRVSLMHTLVGWALARIGLASRLDEEVNSMADEIYQLGKYISDSKLLFQNQEDWALQIMPHVYFKKGYSFEE